jgi:hypothetical protein
MEAFAYMFAISFLLQECCDALHRLAMIKQGSEWYAVEVGCVRYELATVQCISSSHDSQLDLLMA